MHDKFSVSYIDDEGSIIVPKSVRPTIEYEETLLGNKKALRGNFATKTCISENMVIIILFIWMRLILGRILSDTY
jgi:hypothetical protein